VGIINNATSFHREKITLIYRFKP